MTEENPTVPIYDPDRGFRVWLIKEIYQKAEPGGVYVPNKDDLVWDWETGVYQVLSVDSSTLESTLEKWRSPGVNDSLTEEEILTGAAPGRAGECYRLYVNQKTQPITACIDSRLVIYGSEQRSIRLFQGSDITDQGQVVSLAFDEQNTLKDDKWLLESVDDSPAMQIPRSGHLVKGLADGELITAVVYTLGGSVSCVCPLLVVNTAFIRSAHKEEKTVTAIDLLSPFRVSDESDRFEVPLNLPMAAMNFTGRVTYSDGFQRTLPIDGSRFELFGLESFTTSLVGQSIPLLLVYHFLPEESNYNASTDAGDSLVNRYELTTLPAKGAYQLKLFVVPRWNTVKSQWQLRYYLLSMDREPDLEVTRWVEVGFASGAGFQPLLYGETQRLTVALDMSNVDSNYTPFRFVQTFEVTLLTPVADSLPHWTLNYRPGSGALHGAGNAFYAAITEQGLTLALDSHYGWSQEWLDAFYYSLYPLYSPGVETGPLKPSHLVIGYEGAECEMAVDLVLTSTLPFPAQPLAGDTLTVRWLHRTPERDLVLAVSGVTLSYGAI